MGLEQLSQWCVGLAVSADVVSRVQPSSEPPVTVGDFSLGVNLGSDSIPPRPFWMRV